MEPESQQSGDRAAPGGRRRWCLSVRGLMILVPVIGSRPAGPASGEFASSARSWPAHPARPVATSVTIGRSPRVGISQTSSNQRVTGPRRSRVGSSGRVGWSS